MRSTVALSVFDDFRNHTEFVPGPGHQESLAAMLDEVVAWGSVLRALRESRRAAAAS